MVAITATITTTMIYYSIQLDTETALSQEIVKEHLETEGREWRIKKLTEINGKVGSRFLNCFLNILHY